MQVVVGVRFKERGKIYYFDPGDIVVREGDQVLVETVRGQSWVVALGPKEVATEKLVLP